eukprot:SAG31_NODE_2624_length_5360_cov_2.184946_8_plen_60_part_00
MARGGATRLKSKFYPKTQIFFQIAQSDWFQKFTNRFLEFQLKAKSDNILKGDTKLLKDT